MAKKAKAKEKGFVAALERHMNQDSWDKARAAERRGGFADADQIAKDLGLRDGETAVFPAQITNAREGEDGKGYPYLSYTLTGVGGVGKGVQVQKPIFTAPRTFKSGSRTGETQDFFERLEDVFISFKDLNYDTNGDGPFTPTDVAEIVEDITNSKPVLKIRVRYGNGFINVDFQGLLEDSELSALGIEPAVVEEDEDEDEEDPSSTTVKVAVDEDKDDKVEDDKVEDDEDDEEEEDEEDEEEEDEEEDVGVDPVKGMYCLWRAPRARKDADFEVISVNKKKRTVILIKDGDSSRKEYPNISWDDIQIYDDEE